MSREGAVRVAGLQSDGATIHAGLREGDVIVTLDDQPVARIDDLYRLLSADGSTCPAASVDIASRAIMS